MGPAESEAIVEQGPGERLMKTMPQPLICSLLTVLCAGILVLFTDVEGDLGRWLSCREDTTTSSGLQRSCD